MIIPYTKFPQPWRWHPPKNTGFILKVKDFSGKYGEQHGEGGSGTGVFRLSAYAVH